MKDECFADAIAAVGLVGGMVRIDFASLSATEKDAKGKPAMIVRQRVVMPPEGFLRSVAAMQDLVKQLEQAGAIRRVAADGAPGSAKAAAKPPKSPNFS